MQNVQQLVPPTVWCSKRPDETGLMTLPSSSAKTGSAARILPELGRPLATAGAIVRQPLNRLVSGGLNSTVAEVEAPSRCTHKL